MYASSYKLEQLFLISAQKREFRIHIESVRVEPQKPHVRNYFFLCYTLQNRRHSIAYIIQKSITRKQITEIVLANGEG